jgi:hypothetical protein
VKPRLILLAFVLITGCSSKDAVGVAGDVEPHPDGRTLSFAVNSCHGGPETSAEESTTQVRIEVRSDTSGEDECADGATVELEQPLGDREVVDAKTGKALRVRRP